MFNPVEIVKQVLASGGAAFVAAFPAAALAGDYQAARSAVLAALAAGFAAAVSLGGNLLKQLIERARGMLKAGADEAVVLLNEAQAKIVEAKKQLG